MERLGVCLLPLHCALGGGCGEQGCLLGTISLFITILWNLGTWAPLAIRARRSRGDPWAVATKARVPHMYTGSFPGDMGELEWGGGRAQEGSLGLWRVCQFAASCSSIEFLPFRLKLQVRQIGIFHRKTGHFTHPVHRAMEYNHGESTCVSSYRDTSQFAIAL